MMQYDLVMHHRLGKIQPQALLRNNRIIGIPELAAILAQKTGQEPAQVQGLLQLMSDTLWHCLAQGDWIALKGLFSLRWRISTKYDLPEGEEDRPPVYPDDVWTSLESTLQFDECLLEPNLDHLWGDRRVARRIAYQLYPVPVRLQLGDQTWMDFGDTRFLDSETLQPLLVAGTVAQTDFLFLWRIGGTLPEAKVNRAVMEQGRLSLYVDGGQEEIPTELRETLSAQPESSRVDDKVRLGWTSPTPQDLAAVLKHFAPVLHAGVWHQGKRYAVLRKPRYRIASLTPAMVDLHFANIFLSWGEEVLERAASPDAEPVVPEWSNPLGLPGIGELNEWMKHP